MNIESKWDEPTYYNEVHINFPYKNYSNSRHIQDIQMERIDLSQNQIDNVSSQTSHHLLFDYIELYSHHYYTEFLHHMIMNKYETHKLKQ